MITHDADELEEIAEAKSFGIRPCIRCQHCGRRGLVQLRPRRDFDTPTWCCDACLVTASPVSLPSGRIIRSTKSFS